MNNPERTKTKNLVEWNIEGISLTFYKATVEQHEPSQMMVLHHIKYHNWNAGWARFELGNRVKREKLYPNTPDEMRSHYYSLCEDFRELQKRWVKGREYKRMTFVDLLHDIHISQYGDELNDIYLLPEDLRTEGSSAILMYQFMPRSGTFVLNNVLFFKPGESFLTNAVWIKGLMHPDIHYIILTQKGDRLEWTGRTSKSEWEKQDELSDLNSMQCTYPTESRKLMEDLQVLLSKEFHLITEQPTPGHIFVKMTNGTYESFLKVEENENSIVHLKYLHPNLTIIPNQNPNLVGAAIRLYIDTFQEDRKFRFRKASYPGETLQLWLTKFLPSLVWDSEDIYDEITFVYVSNLDKEHFVEVASFEHPQAIGKAVDPKYANPSPLIFTEYEERMMRILVERVTSLYFRRFSQAEEVADINEYYDDIILAEAEDSLSIYQAERFEERQMQEYREAWESGDNPYNFDDFN